MTVLEDNKIIHGNVKVANLFISNSNCSCKISDFKLSNNKQTHDLDRLELAKVFLN